MNINSFIVFQDYFYHWSSSLIAFIQLLLNDKKIEVDIKNIKWLNYNGLDTVFVYGSFEGWEDNVILILDCKNFGGFSLHSWPKKLESPDVEDINQKSLSMGKRFGNYYNSNFYTLLKNNLKLCGQF